MLLDIIVPHYNEPWSVVRPFIDMINNQRGVDFNEFRVILVHDGVERFPDLYIPGPAKIIQVCQPKSGVSAVRNKGLEMSDAKWVNFSDCDDCYSSIFSLYMIMSILRDNEQFDLLWSPFWMIKDNKLRVFKEYNSIFIHNKYYRRSFLIEKDIRFCENLHMSEDSAFNAIVTSRIGEGRVGQINVNEPLYAWCRRPESVTLNPEKKLYNIEGHFDRNLYVLNECRKKSEFDYNLMAARTLTDAYSMLNNPDIPGDSEAFEKRVAEFYRENVDHYLKVSIEDVTRVLRMSDFESGATEDIQKNRPSLNDWLEDLAEKYQL